MKNTKHWNIQCRVHKIRPQADIYSMERLDIWKKHGTRFPLLTEKIKKQIIFFIN